MIDVQFTDAQRGVINAEYWHDLETTQAMALIPGAVRTHWSDGESFIIRADGETDQFKYDTDTQAGKRRLPDAPVILEMMRHSTLSDVARMLGCTPSGLKNRLVRYEAKRADAIGAGMAGAALGKAVADVERGTR